MPWILANLGGGACVMARPLQLAELYVPRAKVERPASRRPFLVAVSLVRNEGDIISAWTSHVCALFDAVFIVDHMSNDGTREFLLTVAASHPGLYVYSFDHPGYFQAEVTNRIAEIATSEYPDCWLFPLDADEFLAIGNKEDLLARVHGIHVSKILRMYWRNCIPLNLLDDTDFSVKMPCLLPPGRASYKKLAIHSTGLIERHWRLYQGNHQVLNEAGTPVSEDIEVDLTDLLHVPLRSVDHFILKCAQGYQAYSELPSERRRDGQGFHWTDMMRKVVKRGNLDPGIVREFAAHYGQPDLATSQGVSTYALVDAGWVCAPLSVARVEPWPQTERRYKFLELAQQIAAEAKGTELEAFVATPRSTLVQRMGRLRNGAPLRASGVKFGRLSESRSTDTRQKSELATFSEFISNAFSPHEHPLPSTWESHVPFLFCLLHYARPRRFVELGTHHGNCFFAACQASRDLNYAIECIAIDTWRGDEHTGVYGEDVFQQFLYILRRNYRKCGKFLRATFDMASYQFDEGSIDLLHIDGLHTYEAVSHDFETWLPKMSDQGIVMLHDTQVYDRGFGVWRLWRELEAKYPSFQFEHGHGLGIVLIGDNAPGSVRTLFDILGKPEYGSLVRFLFSNIGRLSPISPPSPLWRR